MLGVLKRRWKPKRASSERHSIKSETPLQTNDIIVNDKSRIAASPHQIHPLCDEKTQFLAYDSLPPMSDLPTPPPLPLYTYPLAPNICVEGGRIEFIKSPSDHGYDQKTTPTTPTPTLERRATVTRAQQTLYREEKADVAKESLEARVLELERALKLEKDTGQRDRHALTKLQRQLARREVHQRDVDRERRLRLDSEQRLRDSVSEADKERARLSFLQAELSRMEDTVRSMLRYKARSEQLKQELTSQTVAYESRIHQFQNTVTKLNQENEALKKQLNHFEASNEVEVQSALVERLTALETENCNLTSDAELQRRQYERCLDDVANKVVRALLSQKGLREEITTLQRRVVDLETQNRALTSVLVQKLQEGNNMRRIVSQIDSSEDRHFSDTFLSDRLTPGTPSTSISTPSTNEIAEEHALVKRHLCRYQVLDKLWDDSLISPTETAVLSSLSSTDPVLLLPVPRPRSLNLNNGTCVAFTTTSSPGKCRSRLSNGEKTLEDSESPGNRDEGYSTMSSDVQDPLRVNDAVSSTTRGLEDLKEETDVALVTANTPVSNKIIVVEDSCDPDVLYIPLGLTVGLGRNRHSFPPSHTLLPFQHVMRSFSDSHLCLKFMTSPKYEAAHSTYSLSSTTSSSPSILVLSGEQKQTHPLRRTKGINLLATAFEGDEDEELNTSTGSGSWGSGGDLVVEGCWWDADYVQHWLKLDDSRTAIQQQHRDLLELEYDQTELEDWSMSLSSEDITHDSWKKPSSIVEAVTPGILPCIQENNTMELEEDANECLWNNASYLLDCPGGELMTLLLEGEPGGLNIESHCWPYGTSATNFSLASPGGSWSSTGTNSDCCHSYDCSYNCQGYDSKRSSAALSDDATESAAIGTDFTRDFYRLVKFESTKSLASTSSRSQVGEQYGSLTHSQGATDQAVVPGCQDREQALQSVLSFIAEQQQYCATREEEDSGKEVNKSRPSSFVHDPHQDDTDTSYASPHVNSSEGNTYSSVIRDDHETSSFQNNSKPAPISQTNNCPKMLLSPSDSSCIPLSCSNNTQEHAALSESFNFEDIQPSETHDLCNSVLDLNKATETQICIYVQAHEAPVDTYVNLQDNELQNSLNKSDKHTEVILNEQNTFTKHLKNKTFFDGLNGHCIDMKGLLVASAFQTLVNDLGVKSGGTVSDTGICLTMQYPSDASHTEHDAGFLTSLDSQKQVQKVEDITCELVNKPQECQSKPSKKSVEASFEKCRVRTVTPPLVNEQRSFLPASSRITDVLVTVIEETEDEQVSSEVCEPVAEPEASRSTSFLEHTSSKDVIEELNRLIRKGEDGNDVELTGSSSSRSRLDSACCCPTGWVHVERDIDFTDPKARANLLDVMLASSDSSVGSSSSDSGDEPADYQHLHRLHRFRRQKKASATREQLGVLRCAAAASRPSIIGRDDFFVRYGDKERDAVASFDFLEDISTTSVSSNDTLGSRARMAQPVPNTTPSSDDSDDKTGCEGQISFSDSCAASFSGSSASLENQT